jgi:hypothetical protein
MEDLGRLRRRLDLWPRHESTGASPSASFSIEVVTTFGCDDLMLMLLPSVQAGTISDRNARLWRSTAALPDGRAAHLSSSSARTAKFARVATKTSRRNRE